MATVGEIAMVPCHDFDDAGGELFPATVFISETDGAMVSMGIPMDASPWAG